MKDGVEDYLDALLSLLAGDLESFWQNHDRFIATLPYEMQSDLDKAIQSDIALIKGE